MTTIFGTSFGIAVGVILGRLVSMDVQPWEDRGEILLDVLGLLFLAFFFATVTYRLYELMGGT